MSVGIETVSFFFVFFFLFSFSLKQLLLLDAECFQKTKLLKQQPKTKEKKSKHIYMIVLRQQIKNIYKLFFFLVIAFTSVLLNENMQQQKQ